MTTNILPRSYFGDMTDLELKAHPVEMRRLYRSGAYSSSYYDLIKRSIQYHTR